MLNEKVRLHLLKKLDGLHPQYDEDVKMLKVPTQNASGVPYHTRISPEKFEFVHPTRRSLDYARELLDSGDINYEIRAFEIIEKILSLQDTNRANATFGIWSWYLEEPLEDMAPPDWNWADFLGKNLLMIILHHENRIPEGLKGKIKAGIFNACDAIIKRNIGPYYTNIAIMGALVTIAAGEIYQHTPYLEYGIRRLNTFYEYTKRFDTFEEFNSPTYTVLAVEELACIKSIIKNPTILFQTEELLDIAWKSIAQQFHAGTGQWSGPHARCYSTILDDNLRRILHTATKGAVPSPGGGFILGTDRYIDAITCPSMYQKLFTTAEERYLSSVVCEDGFTGEPIVATTYMNPDCVLGTFSNEVLWNQRRNLIAYVKNGASPTYIHLRLLKDGYDFSSGVFQSIQNQLQVLFGISFGKNGGNITPVLDMIHGVFDAQDLRVRLEIGGNLEQVEANLEKLQVKIGQYTVSIKDCFSIFGAEKPVWELNRREDAICLDFVLCSGDKRHFDFHEKMQAAMFFAFSIDKASGLFEASIQQDAEFVEAVWVNQEGREQRMKLSLQPINIRAWK